MAPKRAASAPSPQTAAAKRSRPFDWLGFKRGLEELLGSKADLVQATTVAHAKHVKQHVEASLTPAEKASLARQEWWKTSSITACGKKDGSQAVQRAVIGALLSTQTGIEQSSLAQAKLWAAFPGGPDQLLAALGSDKDTPYTDTLQQLKDAISVTGKCDSGKGKSTPYTQLRPYWIHKALIDLKALKGERIGVPELEGLHNMGPKTAACVLSFTCNRAVLAVDSNIAFAAVELGWFTPSNKDPQKVKTAGSQAIHRGLNGLKAEANVHIEVPNEHRAELHCLLLPFGQLVNASKPGAGHTATAAAQRVAADADVPLDKLLAEVREFAKAWKL